MKKTLLSSLLTIFILLTFSACDTNNVDPAAETTTEAHVHTFEEWVITKEATCATEGSKTHTCACGFTETASISTVEHIWIAATCTTPQTCQICNEKKGDALEHIYTEEVISEASCDQKGSSKLTCSNCGDIKIQTIPFPEYSANEIFEMYKNSVGEIITYDKSGNEHALGSCFVYSQDGKIITNYHVIEESYSANVTIQGKTYPVRHVLAYDKIIDVAVLKIDASDLFALPICKKEHAVGGSVFAFGSSKGLTATFSQGIITCSSREVDDIMYVQHDAAISGGNSGGPLINNHGEVIGVNTWTVRDSQNLNFAIMMSELDNLAFGKSLTLAELYDLECDVFTKVKNYVINNGTFSATDRKYDLALGTSYSNDYSSKYTREISYNVTDDELVFYFFINASNMITITIDEVDGVYEWWYIDDDDYYMYGTLYADTYDSDTLLGYSDHNIYYTSLRTSVRKLASAMVDLLCLYMDRDLSPMGVTSEDLGFLQY